MKESVCFCPGTFPCVTFQLNNTNTFHRKPCVSLPRTESSVTTEYRVRRKHFLFLVWLRLCLSALVKPVVHGSVKTERKQMDLCWNCILVLRLNHVTSPRNLIPTKRSTQGVSNKQESDVTLLVYFLSQKQVRIKGLDSIVYFFQNILNQ